MAKWLIRIADTDDEEEEIGPLTSAELREMAHRGEIAPETMIRKDDSAWVRAIDVNGLFEAAGRHPVCFYCPHCGSELDRKPPAGCIDCGQFIEVEDALEELDQADHVYVPNTAGRDSMNKLRGLWQGLVHRLKRVTRNGEGQGAGPAEDANESPADRDE